MGIHTTYTPEVAAEICDRLAEGIPLRQICRDMGLAWRTIYNWREAQEDFAALFARAREMGEDAIAAECLDIANTPLPGVIETVDPEKGTTVRREDMLGHRKLQIETRLKLLAKWNPSKWGEKSETTHKGDPLAPLSLILNGSDVRG